MSKNMKGLLKGLRYISHIFEEEEEEKEIQIGFPTDVKHVAHIGWDGPSVSSPSWMNEFKSPAPGNATTPLPVEGNANSDAIEDAEEEGWGTSQESMSKESVKESPSLSLPALPRSSRRQASVDSLGSIDSPLGSPSQKTRSSRRRSKQKESGSPRGGESSSSHSLPNIPKKSRRKKSKDADGGSTKSSRSKEKGSRHGSRHGSDDGSVTKQFSSEAIQNSGLATLKEEEVKV